MTAITHPDQAWMEQVTLDDLARAHLHHQWSFDGPTATVQSLVRVWIGDFTPVDISFGEFQALFFLRADSGSSEP